MALDGTATGLRASIADFLNRTDLTAAIPDFIVLAEAQINRRLRVHDQIGTFSYTVTGETYALPSDFLEADSIQLSTGQPLDFLPYDALTQKKWQYPSGTGNPVTNPSGYSIRGTNFVFYPAPTSSITINGSYFQALLPLASNSTNWLLTKYPDAYLYGALLQSAPYLGADERVAVWNSFYTQIMHHIRFPEKGGLGARLTPQPTASQIV